MMSKGSKYSQTEEKHAFIAKSSPEEVVLDDEVIVVVVVVPQVTVSFNILPHVSFLWQSHDGVEEQHEA